MTEEKTSGEKVSEEKQSDGTDTSAADRENTAQNNDGQVKGMAFAAYIIFFLPLFSSVGKDPFVKFHVNQGFNLFLTAVAWQIVSSIFPFIGYTIIRPLGGLFLLALLVMGLLNVSNGRKEELPLIGKFRFIK